MKLRRKLYSRGGSHETTLPQPILFDLDPEKKKYDVVFIYDSSRKKWYIDFEERNLKNKKHKAKK
jgi:hypothetical protein